MVVATPLPIALALLMANTGQNDDVGLTVRSLSNEPCLLDNVNSMFDVFTKQENKEGGAGTRTQNDRQSDSKQRIHVSLILSLLQRAPFTRDEMEDEDCQPCRNLYDRTTTTSPSPDREEEWIEETAEAFFSSLGRVWAVAPNALPDELFLPYAQKI